MEFSFNALRRVLFFVLGLWVHSFAHATVDLLEVPALIAPMAAKSLILDVDSRSDRTVAVGERGVVLYRRSGHSSSSLSSPPVYDSQGLAWQQGQVPVSVNLTGVAFASDDVVFAVGHDGVVLRSRDAGERWELVFDGNEANAQVFQAAQAQFDALEPEVEAARKLATDEPSEKNKVAFQKLEAQLDERLFALEDAQAGARFGPARPLLDVWFKDERQGWVVGSYGQIFETVDGGDSWTLIAQRLNNSDSRHFNALTGDGTGALLIASESGRVYFSDNFGQSWTRYDSDYVGHFYGARLIRKSENSAGPPSAILAYGFGGNVFRFSFWSGQWKQISSPTANSIVDSVTHDAGLLLVDQVGSLIRVDEQGRVLSLLETSSLKAVTGMAMVGDALILSAKGGPRTLKPGVGILKGEGHE